MSDKLMDTEPGGESSQYESIRTFEQPSSKQGGQMGKPETVSQKTTTTSQDLADKGSRTAENVRYGQTISEGGMSGQTSTNSGQANTGGGYGGTARSEEAAGDSAAHQRRAEGYGGDQDMDRDVGA